MLYKRGKFYWLDISIKGKRIRRSLHTSNKLEALSRYAEKKEELIEEFGKGKVRFDDFCKTYLDWAWSSKPASALHEEQRLEKIKDFFQSIDCDVSAQFLDDSASPPLQIRAIYIY